MSATLAARSFSELLNRVKYRGESFVIERGGEAVCRIVPAAAVQCTVADLVGALRAGPKPDAGYFRTLEELAKKQPGMPADPWRR